MCSARRNKPVTHGLNAYKRSLCRCDVCREANREYERKARRQVRKPLHKYVMPLPQDTMTLAEFRKHRGYDTKEGR